MLADYNKIVQLLQKCGTQDVSVAENQLRRLATDDVRIFTCIRQCLQDPTLSKNLHFLAATTINSIFVTNSSEYTQQFSYKFFTHILIQPAISIHIKKQLNRSLMYCLEECEEEYLAKWKQFTNAALCDSNFYDVGLLLLSAFACSEIKNNIIEELEVKAFTFGFGMMVTRIQQSMMELNIGANHQQRNGIDYQSILYTFEVWKIVVEYLLHFDKDQAVILFLKMADSQEFCKALQFATQELGTAKGVHNLFLDAEHPHLETIQQIKIAALQLQCHIIKLIIKHKNGHHTSLFVYTGEAISQYIQTLSYVAHQSHLRSDYEIDQVLISMVQLLKVFIECHPEVLCPTWRSLLHFVIFPLLAINDEELTDFEENTNSYVELSEDICQKQQMEVLKTEVANLLQKITDMSPYVERITQFVNFYNNSEEMGTDMENINEQQGLDKKINSSLIGKYVINYAITSIKHNLGMQFASQDEFLKSLGKPQDASVISIEESFLILSLYSYCLESYPKQVQDLRIILSHEKIKILPPLERARIYVFLAYNYEDIFLNNSKEIGMSIYYWIDMALKQENHPTVAYCALDFVTNSLHKFYHRSVVISLVEKITSCQTPNFWGLLKRMVYLFMGKIEEEVFIQLVKQSFKRITIELQVQMGQQVKITFVINCILNLLRVISENSRMQSMPNLKKMLWEVSKLYSTARIHYFEDDIIKILNSFLFYATKEQIEHQQMKSLLPFMLEDFAKQDYEPTHYYISFNHYIMKGDFQSTVITIYKVLRKSLQHFLGGKRKEAARKKLPIGHNLLLMQNLLAMHGDQLPATEIQFLYEIVKDLYPIQKKSGDKEKLIIYERTLLARALNLQYLCHMYHPKDQVITKLIRYQSCRVYYNYDVGVLLSCLKLTIFKEKDLKNLFDLLKCCVNLVSTFIEMDTLEKIQKVNQFQQKTKQQSEEQNKIEEEESREKSKKKQLMLRIKRVNDFEAILAYINTPFLKCEPKVLSHTKNIKSVEDIRKEFGQLLAQTRNLNQPLFQSFIDGLSKSYVEKIQSIFQIRIENILKGQFGQDKDKRKIFKIKGIKEKVILESESVQVVTEKEDRSSFRQLDESEMNEEEKELLKSQKSQKKRRQKLKIPDAE